MIAAALLAWSIPGTPVATWFLYHFWYVIGCDDDGLPEKVDLRFLLSIIVMWLVVAACWPFALAEILHDIWSGRR